MPNHPIQPLELDDKGVLRFKRNKIVSRLLDEGGIDMNKIAGWDVPREDREQFAQLIGYSHSGAGDLSYMSNEVLSAAQDIYEKGSTEIDARLSYVTTTLENVRNSMRAGVAELYGVHPDDLHGLP